MQGNAGARVGRRIVFAPGVIRCIRERVLRAGDGVQRRQSAQPPLDAASLSPRTVFGSRVETASADALHERRPTEGPPNLMPIQLVDFVYELLDAHDDTADLASGWATDLSWRTHLDYLRALQRKGRELLAHSTVEEARAVIGASASDGFTAASGESAAASNLPARPGR
jgi:hypothetical protein